MKISSKSKAALAIMTDLATNGTSRSLEQIAQSQGLTRSYVSVLVVPLKRAGLISSTRGARGGCTLARKATEISLLSIIEAVDGELRLLDCFGLSHSCGMKGCNHSCCKVWNDVNMRLRADLDVISLENIAMHSQHGK